MNFESSKTGYFVDEVEDSYKLRLYNPNNHYRYIDRMWTLYIGISDFKNLLRKFFKINYYHRDFYRDIVDKFEEVDFDLTYSEKFDVIYNNVYQKIEGYHKYEV